MEGRFLGGKEMSEEVLAFVGAKDKKISGSHDRKDMDSEMAQG